jgi:hypothetical protein
MVQIILFSENYNARTFDISKYNNLIEEVVDRDYLKYKPLFYKNDRNLNTILNQR